jgi:pyruvate dehydrogenase E2 component (dihydrolipoamide acetyltransferase)
LAIGTSESRVIAVNDQPAVASMMEVTLSCDHRAVDGVLGSKFLKSLKKFLEDPSLMLL